MRFQWVSGCIWKMTDLLSRWIWQITQWLRKVRNLITIVSPFYLQYHQHTPFNTNTLHLFKSKIKVLVSFVHFLKVWIQNKKRFYTPRHTRTHILEALNALVVMGERHYYLLAVLMVQTGAHKVNTEVYDFPHSRTAYVWLWLLMLN